MVREDAVPEHEHCRGEEGRPARESTRWQLGTLADGRDRGHPRGPKRRPQTGDERDHRADDEADDDGPGREDRSGRRQVDPDCDEHRVQSLREREPQEEPGDRAEDPDHERLDDHRAQDLASRRADRAKGRELTDALRDCDRERVRDHEAADEEGDAGEREQEVLDEAGEAVDALLVLRHLRGRVPDLCGGRQQGPDLVDQLRRRDAGLRLHADQVELALAPEELLRGREVEDGDRRAADRDARKLHDADDLELLDWAALLDADRVPEREVLVRSDARVDRDLVWPVRPATLR